MGEQFYTILTKVGKAKIANAAALGTKVNLVKFQVGDGGGSYYNPSEDQTQLRNKVWEGNVSSITIDENNPNWMVLETIIPGDIGGFMIREAAALDDEGNIVAIGKYPETYKPIISEGSAKDLYIKMILEIANTSTVTLKIDPSVVLATKKDIENVNKEIVNNKNSINELTTHLADNMYQIPIIVGTQIRINKLSNTNRLFFKLDADLTGGAITISTDGGTTSKPLQDINAIAITTLEKGFVEVVEDTSFFTLRSRGISATDKQALIDVVNNAEVNQSSIKTNIANALNDKISSNLTSASAWTDVQNAISGMTNKKWKSGSATTGTGAGLLTVTGLPFKPSVIIGYCNANTTHYFLYVASKSTTSFYAVNSNTSSFALVTSNGGYINDSSFSLLTGLASSSYTWIAFE